MTRDNDVIPVIYMDGKVRLVHLVCLQTDNFSLFLRQQMDKRQLLFAR
jgi:hypothetical protein